MKKFNTGGTADSADKGANVGGTLGSSMMAKGGEVGEKKEMKLYRIETLAKGNKDVLTDKEDNLYIYEKGILYNTEDGDKKGTSFRMSNINLTIFPYKEFAKGGMIVTSIKDIPNFQKRLDEGKITYRGLGVGKLYDDFYDLAGETGSRIKVDGKEYFITDTEFDTFNRGKDGLMRIRFAAPERKGYAKGGGTGSASNSINDKITEINSLIEWSKDKDNFVGGYFGGTYYEYLDFEKPITTKNQFVYIEYNQGGGNKSSERYNLSKKGEFDSNGLVELKQELSRILSAFKRAKKKYDEKGFFEDGGNINGFNYSIGGL